MQQERSKLRRAIAAVTLLCLLLLVLLPLLTQAPGHGNVPLLALAPILLAGLVLTTGAERVPAFPPLSRRSVATVRPFLFQIPPPNKA